jgi:hypothetical protein
MRALVAISLLVLTTCAGANTAAIGNAALNSAVAIGASAVQRASGGCYSACVPGTTCNPRTGMCDPLPCRGECMANEECVGHPGPFEHCERKVSTPLQIDIKLGEPKKDAAPSDAPTK